eukprot:COSAG01_NODE_49803_length_369_cov_0.474074_1_plen_30_part_01
MAEAAAAAAAAATPFRAPETVWMAPHAATS